MAQSIRDVMTPHPTTLLAAASVFDAACTMRDADIGDVIVLDATGQISGIVTDRDIVVRIVAQVKDPSTTPLGEIFSPELTTLAPTSSVEDAVKA
jgi:CBS domain-containing protein